MYLNPWRVIKTEFFAIEREAAEQRQHAPDNDWRPLIALLVTALVLLGIHYLKFFVVFEAAMQALLGNDDYAQFRQYTYFNLLAELWWGLCHLLGYVIIPILVIRYVFKERLRDYGLAWNEVGRYMPWCIFIVLLVVSFAYFASYRSDFLNHYPFYDLAQRSIVDLLLWECIYIAQFVFLEFFFRGFLLHSCQRRFGATALFIMVVPYVMIHFSKPWLEASGALLFGLVLGLIALRSRSIWGGVFIHTSVALSMDIMALAQTGRLPTNWSP